MKFLIPLFLSLFLFTASSAQIGVGPLEFVKLNAGKFEKEDLTKLKAAKTVFIYRKDDNLEELKAALTSVWTFNELSFAAFEEMDDLDLTNTAIFSVGGVSTNTTYVNSGMNYDNTHIYLNLWMPAKDKKGKPSKTSFCRIELHPTFTDYNQIISLDKENVLPYIYSKADLKNWKVGFLKNYLQVVNDYLNDNSERWLYKSDTKNKGLKALKNKTLYIPDYALTYFNPYTGDESTKQDEAKIFKKYPFKYELIAADELSKKIMTEEKSFYYMAYVKSSTDKYLTIFNSKTGKIVYSKYKPTSYNVKDSDFKDLAKAITSASK